MKQFHNRVFLNKMKWWQIKCNIVTNPSKYNKQNDQRPLCTNSERENSDYNDDDDGREVLMEWWRLRSKGKLSLPSCFALSCGMSINHIRSWSASPWSDAVGLLIFLPAGCLPGLPLPLGSDGKRQRTGPRRWEYCPGVSLWGQALWCKHSLWRTCCWLPWIA